MMCAGLWRYETRDVFFIFYFFKRKIRRLNGRLIEAFNIWDASQHMHLGLPWDATQIYHLISFEYPDIKCKMRLIWVARHSSLYDVQILVQNRCFVRACAVLDDVSDATSMLRSAWWTCFALVDRSATITNALPVFVIHEQWTPNYSLEIIRKITIFIEFWTYNQH